MSNSSIEITALRQIDIIKVKEFESFPETDYVSVEEPLEIRVLYQNGSHMKNISVTMRTPGNDAELAVGFLFTEGIISGFHQVKNVSHSEKECSREQQNVIIVELVDGFVPKLMNTERNFYTTSSCGVCGKGSIAAIKTESAFRNAEKAQQQINTYIIYQLPNKLRTAQDNFSQTGGIHASGLFTFEGELLAMREDVGRHNALDKLIGCSLKTETFPLQNKILLLSGRASFELIQKAAMAGITTVAAIGAPSSLAIDLAKEFDITLIGFLKSNRMNIYHTSKQMQINY